MGSQQPDAVKPFGPSGSLHLVDFAQQLKNNVPIKTSVTLAKRQLGFAFRVVQNELTR